MIDYAALEKTIFNSFIRSNVLSVEEARQHAGLAVDHVKRYVANPGDRRQPTNPSTLISMGKLDG